ncbi:hypothetical protein [Oceanidesulfovibrio marinus]|uniref:Zinc ribbon domain-containing protein n=1 Tax=Oceanidesulfovibrio marinus TaxID=370038 RepID=A0ABX6NFF2_9BACT|nr:hypothetical protein [Oceanidesulfovibrio marinus]QJT08874.1 hypothetical protein E8L03_08005 [Oceanidesulfovibrio marinus]
MSLLISFIILFIGIMIFCNPEWYNDYRGIFYDFSNLRILASSTFVIVGLIGIVTSFRALNRDSQKNEMMICPECQQTITVYTAQDGRCPHCGGELEPLDGFYERHPELLDEDTEPGH